MLFVLSINLLWSVWRKRGSWAPLYRRREDNRQAESVGHADETRR